MIPSVQISLNLHSFSPNKYVIVFLCFLHRLNHLAASNPFASIKVQAFFPEMVNLVFLTNWGEEI